MSEWWTYRLSDFLMFAPRTYYRLFESYNAEIWPLQLSTLALGLAVLWLVWRGTYGRVVAAILAMAWIFVAWAYHWQRYAAINSGAPYYAIGFALEALLLSWLGVRRDGLRFDRCTGPIGYAGYAMLVGGIVLYPLLAPAFSRPWWQAEAFGIAPDPTAIATIGALLLATGRTLWPLVLPVAWCVISAATLWTMDSAEALIPAGAAVLAVAAAVWRWRQRVLRGKRASSICVSANVNAGARSEATER
jgi:hypothetical protein